jgi:hypothetical protein
MYEHEYSHHRFYYYLILCITEGFFELLHLLHVGNQIQRTRPPYVFWKLGPLG